jgi:hypothetical protein
VERYHSFETCYALLTYAIYEEIILNNTAKDLYRDIDNSNTDKWAYLFDKHRDIACSVLKAGIFKYRFTEKELGKLTEKVNEGKCEEVINCNSLDLI